MVGFQSISLGSDTYEIRKLEVVTSHMGRRALMHKSITNLLVL